MSLLFVPRPRPGQAEESPCHYGPQEEAEYIPLTSEALKQLAASLPQPISTVRYSNRKNDYLFSDRESNYCPSLSSSPASATSSTRVSIIPTPEEHEIPVIIAPTSVAPGLLSSHHHHSRPASKPMQKGPLDLDSMFDIEPGFRRASTFDILPDYDEVDNYVLDERAAARLEEERELEKARLLYEKELEDDYPVTVARKPVMPSSLWTPQVRHIISPNFIPSPKVTELTIPSTHSNIPSSESSSFFPLTSTPASYLSPFGSVSTQSTEITIPDEDDDCFSKVDDEFVATVFTYLSLNHNSMARKFDEELAIGSGLNIDTVLKDRKVALKAYIERYIFANPEVTL